MSAYALVFGGFLLLGGRAAGVLGRRKLFVAGIVVSTLASFFAGFAWSEASLMGARALRGLGAAVITPAALSILSTTFTEGRERRRSNWRLRVASEDALWDAAGGDRFALMDGAVRVDPGRDARCTPGALGLV
jgi:MFS family permease